MPSATDAVWGGESEVSTYRTEERELDGLTFKVTRRSLSFTEEVRILNRVINPHTKRPDNLELLALTVEATVKDNDFGLTAERVRTVLKDKPNLAWFLIKWLCAETLRNISPDGAEALPKG